MDCKTCGGGKPLGVVTPKPVAPVTKLVDMTGRKESVVSKLKK